MKVAEALRDEILKRLEDLPAQFPQAGFEEFLGAMINVLADMLTDRTPEERALAYKTVQEHLPRAVAFKLNAEGHLHTAGRG